MVSGGLFATTLTPKANETLHKTSTCLRDYGGGMLSRYGVCNVGVVSRRLESKRKVLIRLVRIHVRAIILCRCFHTMKSVLLFGLIAIACAVPRRAEMSDGSIRNVRMKWTKEGPVCYDSSGIVMPYSIERLTKR